MDDAQNVSQDAVMESLGSPDKAESVLGDDAEAKDSGDQKDPMEELPAYAKKRLGMQEKRHKKELRALQDQLMNLQSQVGSSNQSQMQQSQQPMAGSGDDQIQRAVMMALQAQDEQKRQQKQAEDASYVKQHYQGLQDNLDNASEKYDDFDDVVRAPDAPYTAAMRDVALLLPNSADVLYKLGKSKDELKRISALHPIDQAKEMVKLSVALMDGNGKASSAPRPISPIKSNPASNSDAITDKTPASVIRARMKSGKWK